MGADDYVTKPFADGELFARIRAVLRRKAEPNDDLLQVGDLKMNPLNRQVYRQGRSLKLMPKEYQLLKYLMLNKNKAMSREQILKEVWHIENRNSSNRLDVYIKHLRSKVDCKDCPQLIHTVRNLGYMISDS
jgi:DNA-binding response OmpR family regulator